MHQKLLDYTKKSATDTLITASKRATQNTAKATGDLIGNKIAKIAKNSTQIIHILIHNQMKNRNTLKKEIHHLKKDNKLLIRPMLRKSLFSVVLFSSIIMPNVVYIIHYIWNNIFYKMLHGMSIAYFTYDSFHSISS